MALYDNKYWLLKHIRNSFISTDDTGMCELIMIGEEKRVREKFFSKEPFLDPDESDEDDDEDDQGSYDLQIDAEYMMRERSMTAARLEKLEYHSKKTAKMKHVKWEEKSHDKPGESEDLGPLFVYKKVEDKKVDIGKKSLVTHLIEQSTNMPLNPYTEFARYDGSEQINIPTRTYKIFLTMLPEEQRNYPLTVCCVATAKIQELIGLILLKFSTEYSDTALKPVENYGLFITEEDGEVDSDFPALDTRECVAKFGFICLGLVEHKFPRKELNFESHEEAPATPDSAEGKRRTLSASKAEEHKQNKNDMLLMEGHNKAMEAPLYKSYKVNLVNKIRWWNIEVHLGVSSEKIEIDPISQKNTKLQLVKQAPVSHSMDSIAFCEETETRGSKGCFRVVYSSSFGMGSSSFPGGFGDRHMYPGAFGLSPPLQSSPSFKHYDFEAEKDIAEEIVQKINLILNLRTSQSRREYLAARERKHTNKRKSFKYLRQ